MKYILSLIILFLCAYIMIGLGWDQDNIHPMEIICIIITILTLGYFIGNALIDDEL
jgi:hypothetical protein